MAKKDKDLVTAICLGIAIVVVLFLGFAYLAGAFKNDYKDYKEFKGELFKLEYPKSWVCKANMTSDTTIEKGMFVPNIKVDEIQNSTYGVEVYVSDLASSDRSNITSLEVIIGKYKEKYKQTYTDMKIIREGDFSFAHQQGYELVFRLKKDEKVMRVKQVFTIKDEKLYTVAYQMPEELYAANVLDANKIFTSFQILN